MDGLSQGKKSKRLDRELDSLYVVNMMTNGKMIRLPRKKRQVKRSIKSFRRAIVLEDKIADVAGDAVDVQEKIARLRLKIVEEKKRGNSRYVLDKINNLEDQIAGEQEKLDEIAKDVAKVRRKRNQQRAKAEQLFLYYMMKSNMKKQHKRVRKRRRKSGKQHKKLNSRGLW